MMPQASLLARLQSLIESTYDWTTGIHNLAQYVVGDYGYRIFYAGQEILEELPGEEVGPRTLVTWRGGPVRLGVYYPDALVRHLEAINPLNEISDRNVVAFSLLVEELDHLLMLAWCARHGRDVRLMELEFHANVTKYFVLAHFLGRATRRARLTSAQRQWIHRHLFWGIGEGLPEPQNHRYRVAARLALRYVRSLENLAGMERLTVLRRFARWSWLNQRTCLESVEFPTESGFLGAL
jgi:hypothetical protein